MPLIILCGGQGTRLKEETEYKPKPMVEIGGKPILWHIMKIYSYFGFNEFILALGFKGNVIRDYFLNYDFYSNDFTINIGNHKDIEIHGNSDEKNWKVTLVETGLETMTGARVKRCEKYINEDNFLLTYGDGLSNVNIKKIVNYHINHGKIGTLTGVKPPTRFGELVTKNNQVIKFKEKPKLEGLEGDINGGFMVFKKEFFNYLYIDSNCVLEGEPLEKLASDRQLMVFYHNDFWQCMDTYRDFLILREMWESNKAPWKLY
ncbi:MAG: glucose-1-phosphate cytidylyltransferase [Candidatus Marinimicrobia bacterium]|nr:glucose-1-phosphate cytidylyltransferase [Candidatus Neomarinimicrobiota bacterium]